MNHRLRTAVFIAFVACDAACADCPVKASFVLKDAYQALKAPAYYAAVGDINGDGYLDLAVSDSRSEVRFFLNDGPGPSGTHACAESPRPGSCAGSKAAAGACARASRTAA